MFSNTLNTKKGMLPYFSSFKKHHELDICQMSKQSQRQNLYLKPCCNLGLDWDVSKLT